MAATTRHRRGWLLLFALCLLSLAGCDSIRTRRDPESDQKRTQLGAGQLGVRHRRARESVPATAFSKTLSGMASVVDLTEHDVKHSNPKLKDCAVVSNSPSMLLYERGPQIDAHENIFRLNFPPVREHAAQVGVRTTHVVTQWMRVLLKPYIEGADFVSGDSNHLLEQNGYTNITALVMNSQCVNITMKRALSRDWAASVEEVESASRFTPSSVRSDRRRFELETNCVEKAVQAAKWMSRNKSWKVRTCVQDCLSPSLSLRKRARLKSIPSTGWNAIAFALNTCDCLTLYGFTSNVAKGHYWDAPGAQIYAMARKHELHLEKSALRLMESSTPCLNILP